MLDYLACILFKVLGAFLRCLPLELSFFLGRRLGDCFYYFDLKHKARSYANIKVALGNELPPKLISKTTKDFYQSFGQSIVEIFLIPKVDRGYIEKYVTVEGLENIRNGLKKGKGVILLSVHAGSWELSNIICANFGFPFALFVRGQRFPRLNQLLNRYRQEKGCKIITREGGIKQLIEAFKSNSAVGITQDQGGKDGRLVEFFRRRASMPTGWIKLALKYDASVIPVYFTRETGPKIKIFVGKPLELVKSGDAQRDIDENLKIGTKVFEEFIRKYPKEYLWTYKIWKYSDQSNILILSDGKTGHLRQSESVAGIALNLLKKKGIQAGINVIEVKFKNEFSRKALFLSGCLAGKYHCQGCLGCLKRSLQAETFKALSSFSPDMVISCGASLAAINFIVSRQNLSKSVVLMRPSILSMKRFDLVIMPRHDHPPKKKNVVITEGALNLVDDRYLGEQSVKLARFFNLNINSLYVGLLIGGDSKNFVLDKELVSKALKEAKAAAEGINADILLTTSRRTPVKVQDLIKQEFKNYNRAKLVIIANESNFPAAVGGILGLSKIVITSPESISMISEAANSGKFVLVFKAQGLSGKHKEFLGNFSKEKYIYLTEVDKLAQTIKNIWHDNPAVNALKDNSCVSQALERIL